MPALHRCERVFIPSHRCERVFIPPVLHLTGTSTSRSTQKMCIIFNPSHFSASDTLVLVAPISTPSHQPQRWHLTYVNTVTSVNPFSTSYFSPGQPNRPLMVVPLPNPHHIGEQDFSLFPVNDTDASVLRRSVSSLTRKYEKDKYSPQMGPSNTFGANVTSQSMLRVVQVGGYKVCVAPSLSDLEKRAPWDRFSSSKAEITRTLGDIRSRYAAQDMAFVIAEGYTDASTGQLFLRQAGFSVSYRDALGGAFFPTSHEPPVIGTTVNMDVMLIAINAVIQPLSILSQQALGRLRPENDVNSDMIVLRADDSYTTAENKWGSLRSLMKALPRNAVEDGEMIQFERPRLVTAWSLKGRYENRDVRGRSVTEMDVDVTHRLYDDVDTWMRSRMLKNPRLGTPSESLFGAFGPSSPGNAPTLSPNGELVSRLDYALALLARQLASPGINDRVSDAIRPGDSERSQCGPVAFVNLDINDVDLDEEGYQNKDNWARWVRSGTLDSSATTYVRISAQRSSHETMEMRTVACSSVSGEKEHSKA